MSGDVIIRVTKSQGMYLEKITIIVTVMVYYPNVCLICPLLFLSQWPKLNFHDLQCLPHTPKKMNFRQVNAMNDGIHLFILESRCKGYVNRYRSIQHIFVSLKLHAHHASH